MKALYQFAKISKQGHFQGLRRQEAWEQISPSYIGMMEEFRQIHPGMGLRSIYEHLKPEGIGRDAFIALGLEAGYRLQQTPRSPVKTTKSIPTARYRNLLTHIKVTDVNQVWVSDITYYQLDEGYHYIVLIMDVYSRRIIGYSGADNLRAVNNLSALESALSFRGIKHYQNQLIHHSDRGSQYIYDNYTSLLENRGIRISMCLNVLENAHIERLNGTIKNQYLIPWNVCSKKRFLPMLKKAVENYNKRNHKSLNKTSPVDFENALKDIPLKNRAPLTIFTASLQAPNPAQLSLFNA